MIRFARITSIQGRLGIVFLAFLMLLLVSVLVTFFSLETQKQDARAINLAGRQRMLLQQMSSLAFGYQHEPTEHYTRDLQEAVRSFQQTLTLLQQGGAVIDYTGNEFSLSHPAGQRLQIELDALDRMWAIYRADVNLLLGPPEPAGTGEIVTRIEVQSSAIIDQADRVVRIYELVSNEKIARLRFFQIIFLAVGLVLLSIGWWVTRKSVVLPLSQLGQSAERIGAGDFIAPVAVQGPEEAMVLGRTMEAMRVQMLASRQELLLWNSSLENRVQQRTRELEALAVVSRDINSHLSIGEVLNSVAVKAQELSASEVASLCLLDQQGKELTLHAASGAENSIRQTQSPADVPGVGDIFAYPSAHACGLQICKGFCQIIGREYRTSHLAAPLYSGTKVIGALCVGSSCPDAFRPEIAGVLTQLAEIATVAIENSRLYEQAEHAAMLEERQRIASEMHDGLLQTLSFLGLMVQWAKDQIVSGDHEKTLSTLLQIERAEEQAECEIRRTIASFQYDFPLNYTLQEQLAVLAEELSHTNPPVQYEATLVLPIILPNQESEQALRVVREALLNAQRYSQSEIVYLLLAGDSNEVVITIEDHGVGFDPEAVPNNSRAHFGVKIMRARAVRLGGALTIRSLPGARTTVELRWTPVLISTI